MKGYLYLISNNINGKKYVGKTYKTVNIRWTQHIDESRRLDRPLHRAIRKYGIHNFSISELGSFESGILEQKEIEYICMYNTFAKGYNATTGGDGRPYLDLDPSEVSRKYLELGSVKAVARELKVDQQSVRKLLTDIDPYGNSTYKRPVILVELDLCFNSVQECAKSLIECEITKAPCKGVASHIRDVANNKRKSAYGFTYRWSREAEGSPSAS